MSARAAAALIVLGGVGYLAYRALSPSASTAPQYDPTAWYLTSGEPSSYEWSAGAASDDASVQAEAEGEGAPILWGYDEYILPIFNKAASFYAQQTGGQYMRVSVQGIDAIRRHEALRLEPYKDIAGHWTVGYGHKLLPHEPVERITEEKAIAYLTQDVGIAEDAVNASVLVPITQAQFDALASLVYNIGARRFRQSTLLRKLNAGDYAGAQAQFLVWNKARIGGVLQVSRGLNNRRVAEAQMFGGVYA